MGRLLVTAVILALQTCQYAHALTEHVTEVTGLYKSLLSHDVTDIAVAADLNLAAWNATWGTVTLNRNVTIRASDELAARQALPNFEYGHLNGRVGLAPNVTLTLSRLRLDNNLGPEKWYPLFLKQSADATLVVKVGAQFQPGPK